MRIAAWCASALKTNSTNCCPRSKRTTKTGKQVKLLLKKMRQCRLNFADNRYDCEAGIIGEHYATELIVTPPAIMPAEAVYRLCFEPGGLSEIILQTTDGAFSYPLPSAVTATPYCCVTLIGYVGSEQIYKSRMVRLHFSQTADGDSSIDLQQPGIVDEVNRNTAARHTHANKSVLDRLSDADGKLQFDGKEISGGGGAATAADVNYELPEEVQTEFPWAEIEENTVKAGLDTAIYYALAGMYAKYIGVTLQGAAGTVDVSLQNFINNTYIPVANKAHEHDNKSILDEITAEKVNIWDNKQAKPSQVTSGTTITLADNTEYRLTDVTTLTLNYPVGDFECWIRLTFAESGTITVTLPAGTGYIGTAPDFKNGETWELSFKDKILAAQKVGEGT
uniref:Tail protein n=1 Tax=Siphoviridae sp. ct9UA16 TaxID=2827793 RepID=A0A8S5TMF5_9CAUD|nr:MAG TPA: hypothetical protein [Siphoviridae sp. ct9UA16]